MILRYFILEYRKYRGDFMKNKIHDARAKYQAMKSVGMYSKDYLKDAKKKILK